MPEDAVTAPLDPRQIRTRERVFTAARAVLRREGLGGASVDAIAAEAGVARSTVYRNWTSRDELLSEAFDDLFAPPTSDDPTRSLRDRLSRVLFELADGLSSSEWGHTLPAVVAAIDAEPALAATYGRLTDERRAAVTALVRSAIDAGEVDPGVAIDELIDALVGPLFYRRLVRQLPSTRPWVHRHLTRTLDAFGIDSHIG